MPTGTDAGFLLWRRRRRRDFSEEKLLFADVFQTLSTERCAQRVSERCHSSPLECVTTYTREEAVVRIAVRAYWV
tara:strand:- start:26156 stop:26380 length:225 start_codon:yes stop_codon:yes gene_type:complete